MTIPSVKDFFAQYAEQFKPIEQVIAFDKGSEKGDFSCEIFGVIEKGKMIITRFEFKDESGNVIAGEA